MPSPVGPRLETSEVFTSIEQAAHGETSEVFRSNPACGISLLGRRPRLPGHALRLPKSLRRLFAEGQNNTASSFFNWTSVHWAILAQIICSVSLGGFVG